LLDLYSQLVATGRDKLPPPTAESLIDIKLEKRRLELEERKLIQKGELEKLRLNEQVEQRKVQAQLVSKKLNVEIEPMRQQNASAESAAALLKRYGDALRSVLSRMPNNPADISAFFDNVERVFKDTDIPPNYQAQLLMPYLTAKGRAMVGRMDQKRHHATQK